MHPESKDKVSLKALKGFRVCLRIYLFAEKVSLTLFSFISGAYWEKQFSV